MLIEERRRYLTLSSRHVCGSLTIDVFRKIIYFATEHGILNYCV